MKGADRRIKDLYIEESFNIIRSIENNIEKFKVPLEKWVRIIYESILFLKSIFIADGILFLNPIDINFNFKMYSF